MSLRRAHIVGLDGLEGMGLYSPQSCPSSSETRKLLRGANRCWNSVKRHIRSKLPFRLGGMVFVETRTESIMAQSLHMRHDMALGRSRKNSREGPRHRIEDNLCS